MKHRIKIIAALLSVFTLVSVIAIPVSAGIGYPMAVTIYYKDEAGNQVSPTVSRSIDAADTNKPTWTSPYISGYALKNESDATVTYDMLEKHFPPSHYQRNATATYTVTYVKTHSHTVYYLDAATNSTVARQQGVVGKPGMSFTLYTLGIYGMTPTKSSVTGTIGNSDTFETVYFYKNVYTVTYDANGGYGAPAAQTKEHGQTLTISTKRPTRYGHAFLGWGETPTATSTYISGGSFTGDYSTTLYAIWLADRYTIRLNANGGSFSVSSLTKIYGHTLTLPDTVPTRSGYNFLGWSSNRTATTATYGAGGSYTLNRNETLYAVWEKIPETYAVYYNANGGSGAPAWQVKTEGIPLTLSSVAPSRTGYIFMGWATSADSKTVAYIPDGTYTQDASVTLYAVWSPKTYTVTYDANGGINAPSAQSKTHDSVLTLRTETPYRDRYKFLGWSTDNTAMLPTFYPGSEYDLEGNKTLYAVWEYINYDFSVSDLTVTPNEARQYDTVHVRFRLDSWDQKNAYEDVPVEVVLNGGIIYSQTVDFAVYGVNYVDFDLNVGALEGLQTITAWVNRDDYNNETRTGNNNVSATFTVNKVVELKTSYVAPNADYIEGNEVVTSFYVTNSSPSAILPDDHIDYTFEVYTLDASGNETVVHRDTWSDVVIPGNATNLVYFKWQIPQDSAGTLYWCRGFVNENQAIIEDDLSNNRTEFSKYSVNYEESQTPNTRYESQAPAGYNSNVNAPSEQTGKATWNQWEYANGTFVLKTYGIQVSSGNPTIRPSDACKTATYSGGKWTMKSGYGISLIYSPVIAYISGYASPQGTAYTGVQNIFALFPEYGYSTDEGSYRTLKYSHGAYRFFENSDADGNERLHFIPVYVQDGGYTVSVTVTQIWTPAGMITAVRNSNTVMIDGTIYDDYYVGD